MPRSYLLNSLHSALDEALGDDALPVTTSLLSRRTFLKRSALLAGSAAGMRFVDRVDATPYSAQIRPRIAIIGAGLAGLTAAYELQLGNLSVDLFEASERAGGRIFTAHDLFFQGGWTELGGEFIDSNHHDILRLADKLQLLQRVDRRSEERKLERHSYYIDGSHRPLKEVSSQFRNIWPQIHGDLKHLPAIIGSKSKSPVVVRLDRMPLSDYLYRLPADRWFRDLLNIAYLSEYGRETSEQSTLNFLSLIAPQRRTNEFDAYGESDERFKITGGNERLILEMKRQLPDIKYGHTLTRISGVGSCHRLSFDRSAAVAIEADYDIVIIAIPFTLLRAVDIRVRMSDQKQQAIRELGYGRSTKVIAGFNSRPWTRAGLSGYSFSDTGYQSSWDSTEGQRSVAGSLTFYLGGKAAMDAENVSEDFVRSLVRQTEPIFPGSSESFTGKYAKFGWGSFRYSHGSYSAYGVGQCTSFGGSEAETEGNVYFAGEHCSRAYQGFMNGAVETGRRAALRILERVAR